MFRFARFFYRFILRPLGGMGRSGDRLRTGLSLLTVGLGVGVVLAIQLANRSALGSFESSLAEISGRTNLSILGTNGIDELLLPRLTAILGPEVQSSPVLESTAVVPSTREMVRVLGTDIVEDKPFREITLQGSRLSSRDFLLLLLRPDSVVVGESLAHRLGLRPGSQFPLLINDRQSLYTVRGILAPRGAGKVWRAILSSWTLRPRSSL